MTVKAKKTLNINWTLGLVLGSVTFGIGALSSDARFDVTLVAIFCCFVGAFILPTLLQRAVDHITVVQKATSDALMKENRELKIEIQTLKEANANLQERLAIAEQYNDEKKLGKVPRKNYVLIHVLVSLLRKNYGNVSYEALCHAVGELFDEYYAKHSSKTNHGYGEKSLSNLFRKAKKETSEEDFGLGTEEEFIEWATKNFEQKLKNAKIN